MPDKPSVEQRLERAAGARGGGESDLSLAAASDLGRAFFHAWAIYWREMAERAPRPRERQRYRKFAAHFEVLALGKRDPAIRGRRRRPRFLPAD